MRTSPIGAFAASRLRAFAIVIAGDRHAPRPTRSPSSPAPPTASAPRRPSSSPKQGAAVVLGDIDDRGRRPTCATGSSPPAGRRCSSTPTSRTRPRRPRWRPPPRSTFGRLDILVNNAATFVLKGLDATREDWHRSLDVNVIGTSMVTRAAAAVMARRGGGAIVNLASISSFVAQPQFVTYSATKAAILQMTRNLALDLAPRSIRVNCVCPGTILTRASRDHMARVGMSLDEFVAAEAPKHLLNRVGDAARSRLRHPVSRLRRRLVHHGHAPDGGRRLHGHLTSPRRATVGPRCDTLRGTMRR